MPIFRFVFKCALALGFAGMFAASATQASAQANKVDLTMCNKTGSKIYIATMSYQTTSKTWLLSAWKSRAPGECKSAGSYEPGLFYYFAEKEGGKFHWPSEAKADKPFCVPRSAVERKHAPGSCAQGERLLGFMGTVLSGTKSTINFNN